MIPEKKWKWFGNAAHFICGRWCRFHMATQVGGYLVSTVGEYVHPSHGKGSEIAEMEWVAANYPGADIGCGRKYETMVFKAGPPCDAAGCNCGLPTINGSELDMRGYMTAGAAAAGHRELCKVWATKPSMN